MYFDMYGPFELAREDGKVASRQPELWAEVRRQSRNYGYHEQGLETAIGCYAFGLRHPSGLRPWYIGMTIARAGFRGEVLQQHKRDHYDAALGERTGTPVLFLMPLLTAESRFSQDRGRSKPLIEWVEKMLFGVALRRNPKCRNQRDTRYLRNVVVRGVFNNHAGRPGPSVVEARRMFGTS